LNSGLCFQLSQHCYWEPFPDPNNPPDCNPWAPNS
jgi:hypothetical protein